MNRSDLARLSRVGRRLLKKPRRARIRPRKAECYWLLGCAARNTMTIEKTHEAARDHLDGATTRKTTDVSGVELSWGLAPTAQMLEIDPSHIAKGA